MNFSQYQILSRRTQDHTLADGDRLNHALRGLASECGEINGIFQKQIQKHPVQVEDVVEELGDLLWFCAELADCFGLDLGSVAAANVAKLQGRYPDGFDAERSIHREV